MHYDHALKVLQSIDIGVGHFFVEFELVQKAVLFFQKTPFSMLECGKSDRIVLKTLSYTTVVNLHS